VPFVGSRRRSAWHSLLLIAALAGPRSVLAQAESAPAPAPASAAAPALAAAPAPASDPAAVARARFEAGVTAFDQGRFRDAVELFKEADRLAPSARLSFNIAKVYERMGDNRGALAAYRDYLRRLPGAENRAEVSRRVAELEQSLMALGVQQLRVSTMPEGAELWIDQVSRGVTPWVGELVPGQHALEVRASGHRDAHRDFELPARQAIDIDVPLEASAASGADRARAAAAAAGGGSRAPAPSLASPSHAASARAASSSAASTSAAPPAPLEGIPAPSVRTWALWGGSGLALVGAGLFEIARGSAEGDARRTPYQIEYKDRFEAMEHRQTAARVCLGVGILGALVGGASYYFDVRRARSTEASLACDGAGCALRAGGVF
jgi:tetratricopeptide (TPR) repeat protein